MEVTQNNKMKAWIDGQSTPGLAQKYINHCTEAANNDLSQWRNVGKGSYDFRADGNHRVVAHKDGDNFYVSAIYKHGTNGGKTLIAGQAVAGY